MGRCRINPVGVYDLSPAARFFSARSPLGEEIQNGTSGERLEKLALIAVINEQPVHVEVTESGESDSQSLEVCWEELVWSSDGRKGKRRGSVGEKVTAKDVKKYLRHVLSLDVDLQAFYETLGRDKQLKSLTRTLHGFKPVLTPSVFDAGLWAIVGQQVTLGFALTLKERLAERYGRRFGFGVREMFAAPTAEDLARAEISDLRELQLSQRKSEYLLTLSQAVVEGSLDLEALASEGYESACEKLIALRGIGVWTANYILMRGAGHLDALPLGDAGLRRAIRSAYSLEAPPTDEKITELAEPFRPYRSLYTMYLWQGYA